MNWFAAVSALTPLLIALGIGIRWLGGQIWSINRLLATQNEAIKWQNQQFEDLMRFDTSAEQEIDLLAQRISDLERYLEVQSCNFERPFITRGRPLRGLDVH